MRLYRISFIAGLAIGFVAGTRAGRERYDQMVKLARQVGDNPTFQQAAGAIQAQATGLFNAASKRVTGELHDRVPQLAHSAAQLVGDHIPGLRRDGHDASSADGGSGAGNGRPFAARSSQPPAAGSGDPGTS